MLIKVVEVRVVLRSVVAWLFLFFCKHERHSREFTSTLPTLHTPIFTVMGMYGTRMPSLSMVAGIVVAATSVVDGVVAPSNAVPKP